jgi:site-specific DNA-methyltransferase (adenine-specific)|tara:strand:+ start:727 stop:1458 length:732 start_codon:yes stop_codon:yes gene_type:complete
LEILKGIPEESVDLIFADPPYNLSNDGITCKGGRMVSVNKGDWDKSKGIVEDYAFHLEWIEACKGVMKPNATIWISGTYHSIYACGHALQKLSYHILNDICWLKPNASPNLSCRFFTASHETLLWAKKDKSAKHIFNYEDMKNGNYPNDSLKVSNKQMRSVWSIPATPKSQKSFGAHPTQKPIKLLDRVVLSSSNPGDTILDPFMGSGTTGVVAINHGRSFIGIEANKEYCNISRNRIEAEIK